MHYKLLSWVFLLGLCVALVSPVAAQNREPGRILLARVTGDVTLTDKDTQVKTSAKDGVAITAGTVVTTVKGASVVLVFSNGSTINLGTDSVLDIEEYLQDPFEAADQKVADMTSEPSSSTTTLNLTRGELVGNVKKLNTQSGSRFEVKTPVGAAGIRGTTFRIVFRPDSVNPNRMLFTLSTAEGLVDVTMQGAAEGTLPVGDNREIVVEVDVNIDATTGAVTVTAPPQIVTQAIPAPTQAVITTAVQAVLEAVQDVVVPTTTSTDNSTSSTTPESSESTEKTEKTTEQTSKLQADPPPPVTPPPTTTPGAGTEG